MEQSQFQLNHLFYRFTPERLADARLPLPVDESGFVPLMMFGRPLTMVDPILIRSVGRGVALSLGRPFGFMKGQYGGEIQRTVQTYGIFLSSDPERQHRWLARFDTERPLTRADVSLFSEGVGFYADRARYKLNRMR